MFDTLLASKMGPSPWVRPAAAAILLHLGIILGAVTGTATSPMSAPAVRDTIRLEIGRPASSKRQSISRAAPPNPHSIFPAPAPLIPDIPLVAPRLDTPRSDLNTPLDPVALSGTASANDSAPASALGGPSSAFAVTEVDQLPELAHALNPQYPEALRQSGLSGTVQLEYLISTDGRVDSGTIRVVQSTHRAFAAAAIKAVRGARFKPAQRGGRPVAVLVQQTIRFFSR